MHEPRSPDTRVGRLLFVYICSVYDMICLDYFPEYPAVSS